MYTVGRRSDSYGHVGIRGFQASNAKFIRAKMIFWSTRNSIKSETASFTAIAETVLAVAAYWWIAVHYETYLPLIVSVIVRPLVLLRSDESTAKGRVWFLTWFPREMFNLKMTARQARLIAVILLVMSLISSYLVTKYVMHVVSPTA